MKLFPIACFVVGLKQSLSLSVIRSNVSTTRVIGTKRLKPLSFSLAPTVEVSPSTSVGLVLASLVGMRVERTLLPDSSILVTMILGAVARGFVPHSPFLEDIAWSTFLPGSLALLLLSMKKRANAADTSEQSIGEAVTRVGVPFVIASIASVAGCFLSFLLTSMPNESAAIATSCLAASFVGGSVNFLATAKQIGKNESLIGSMATADLVVTAIFFAILSASWQSKRLRKVYHMKTDEREKTLGSPITERSTTKERFIDTQEEVRTSLWQNRIPSGVAASSLAWVIVRVSAQFESSINRWVPGTACAFITILAPLTRKLCQRYKWWSSIRNVSGPLSEFYFLLLFASMGMSADLQAALSTGPACLAISFGALVVHLLGTFLGTLGANRWMSQKMRLEEVLVASNAAIGGPATAAAFAGRLGIQQQRSLTYAATVWGVVGYAIGTTLGISFYRLLKTSFRI